MEENKWIHTFPKGISAMWNAISLVQIWTRVAVSISCDDNHYTTGTSSNPYMLLKYEIIWTTIGQVIRLRNDISFTETVVWENDSKICIWY